MKELFNKLKDGELVLYLVETPSLVEYKDFEEIEAIDFVKRCLKFEDLYGNWITLGEIEKMGKKSIVINIDPRFIGDFKDKFERL